MKERRLNEFKGVILIAVSLIVLASIFSFNAFDLPFYTSHPNVPPHNFIRTFGAYLAGALLFLFGWASYVVPFVIFMLGIRIFRHQIPDFRLPRILGIVVLLLSTSSIFGMLAGRNESAVISRGGLFGAIISNLISDYFGKLGAYIILATLSLLALALVTEILISTFISKIIDNTKPIFKPMFGWFNFKGVFPKPKTKINISQGSPADKEKSLTSEPKIKVEEPPRTILPLKPKIQIKTKSDDSQEIKARPKEVKIGDYHLPSIDLLESPPALEARQIKDDLAANARILEETLDDFGISAKVTDIEKGPVITRYELEPAPGVKVNRITALGDDIALAMKAQSVRIVAPIPGKSRVGVEVPNTQSSIVYVKELFASKEFLAQKSKLTLALGKDIAGQPVITDLEDMPHLLIAGTTGSGKTVCVNCIILSMLFRAAPHELKFLMIDPKMVELAPYNGLPHLLCPVVTDAKKAAVGLNWVVSEMEDRYQLLAKAGARNITSYNEKQEEKIPYIVVVVDELADLMMVSRDQIEGAITRLAQLSRAVGIHLVLATQRPSVDVITGVIKANFPARISFKVASKVDSRTVLDMNGADKLLGRGDMLFMEPGAEKLVRAQGSLVSDKEIEQVVDFIRKQAEPVYDDEILKEQQRSAAGGGQKDELYDEAVRVVIETNQASVSILQRRMRLGYTRAARIIDQMEQEGIVGPFEGSKPRRLLVDREAWLKNDLMQKEEIKE